MSFLDLIWISILSMTAIAGLGLVIFTLSALFVALVLAPTYILRWWRNRKRRRLFQPTYKYRPYVPPKPW